MGTLADIGGGVYINPDQVQIIRPATENEKLGRNCKPNCTTIILQPGLSYYIKGYPREIHHKLYPDKKEQCDERR